MSLYHFPIDAAPPILTKAWIDNGRKEIEVWIPVLANVIINVNDNNGDEDEDDGMTMIDPGVVWQFAGAAQQQCDSFAPKVFHSILSSQHFSPKRLLFQFAISA